MGVSNAWNLTVNPCDSCNSAALCLSCDTDIHSKLTHPHERVWMCEVCEQAPVAVTCKADAAVLCVTCDSDIHAANSLASHHERSPGRPFFDAVESMVTRSTAFNFLDLLDDDSTAAGGACSILDAAKVEAGPDVLKACDFSAIFNVHDPLLDFDYGTNNQYSPGARNDGLVPVQAALLQPPSATDTISPEKLPSSFVSQFGQHFISHSVSSSSLEVGVVPEGHCNSLSNNSYPLVQTTKNQLGGTTLLDGLDREARVLRYREKRKNRKFAKTIRYASRQAYAETRPRIKGRFAKRTESDSRICISTQYYGAVPTL